MKNLFRDRFWKIGRNLSNGSIVLFFVLAAAATSSDASENLWFVPTANALCIVFLIGALIVWSFAIRFYAQNHLSFGVVRSAFYLLILICMNWVSAFIFIAVEGRPRFFGTTEQDNKIEQGGDGDAEEAV